MSGVWPKQFFFDRSGLVRCGLWPSSTASTSFAPAPAAVCSAVTSKFPAMFIAWTLVLSSASSEIACFSLASAASSASGSGPPFLRSSSEAASTRALKSRARFAVAGSRSSPSSSSPALGASATSCSTPVALCRALDTASTNSGSPHGSPVCTSVTSTSLIVPSSDLAVSSDIGAWLLVRTSELASVDMFLKLYAEGVITWHLCAK